MHNRPGRYEPPCDHQWVRDDQITKQCIRCKAYAPIREGDFDG